MVDIETVSEEKRRIKALYDNAKSYSRKKDLIRDLLEITSLEYAINGYDINALPAQFFDNEYYYNFENECFAFVMEDFDRRLPYYLGQSENVLKAFSKNNFDIDFYRRKTGYSSLNINEGIDLARQFLAGINNQAYRLFMDMYKDGRIFNGEISIGKLAGKCYNINSFRKSYITLEGEKTNLPFLELLMHEFGHSYEFSLLRDKNFAQRYGVYKTNFHETCSFFFETAFLEFLKKNHVNDVEAHYLNSKFLDYTFMHALALYYVTHSQYLDFEDYFLQLPREENDRLSDEVFEEYGYDVFMDQITEIDVNEATVYTNGLLSARSLYEKYKLDPNEFMRAFDNCLMSYGMNPSTNEFGVLGATDKALYDAKMINRELSNFRKEGIRLNLK